MVFRYKCRGTTLFGSTQLCQIVELCFFALKILNTVGSADFISKNVKKTQKASGRRKFFIECGCNRIMDAFHVLHLNYIPLTIDIAYVIAVNELKLIMVLVGEEFLKLTAIKNHQKINISESCIIIS